MPVSHSLRCFNLNTHVMVICTLLIRNGIIQIYLISSFAFLKQKITCDIFNDVCIR